MVAPPGERPVPHLYPPGHASGRPDCLGRVEPAAGWSDPRPAAENATGSRIGLWSGQWGGLATICGELPEIAACGPKPGQSDRSEARQAAGRLERIALLGRGIATFASRRWRWRQRSARRVRARQRTGGCVAGHASGRPDCLGRVEPAAGWSDPRPAAENATGSRVGLRHGRWVGWRRSVENFLKSPLVDQTRPVGLIGGVPGRSMVGVNCLCWAGESPSPRHDDGDGDSPRLGGSGHRGGQVCC